mgnify:FL=1
METKERAESEPVYVDLEIESESAVEEVFLGFRTSDGSEHILCESAPPISVSLQGASHADG